MEELQPRVVELMQLLEVNHELRTALTAAIQEAGEKDISSLDEFYYFLNGLLTHIPTEEQLNASTSTFWIVLNKSPNHVLKKSAVFNEWITRFMLSMGSFMDTTASAEAINTFKKHPKINIEDYYEGPSGWFTYNQFLARQVKPGKRPVAALCNNDVIVSPTDSIYLGKWQMNNNATISVKGDTYNINDLLANSRYQSKFKGGIFTHFYLSVYDYHRFHTPVSGTVVETKLIAGRTWTNEIKNFLGEKVVDDIGFQFNQTRGYIILKTKKLGYVAVVPVGMGFVSSVNITVEIGSQLVKGQEFGFFAYGGSDIILLFEPKRVKFTAFANKHYLQGEKIAKAV